MHSLLLDLDSLSFFLFFFSFSLCTEIQFTRLKHIISLFLSFFSFLFLFVQRFNSLDSSDEPSIRTCFFGTAKPGPVVIPPPVGTPCCGYCEISPTCAQDCPVWVSVMFFKFADGQAWCIMIFSNVAPHLKLVNKKKMSAPPRSVTNSPPYHSPLSILKL